MRAHVCETLMSERCGVATHHLPRGVVRLRRRFDAPRPSLVRLWGRRTEAEALRLSGWFDSGKVLSAWSSL